MKRHSHSLKVNALFAAIVALLLAAVALLNGILLVLSNRYPLHVDLTAGAVYEIGEDTKALLAAIDEPVDIYVLSGEDGFSGSAYLIQAGRIISQYGRYSDKVALHYIDYAADPTFAVGYPDLNLGYGDLIVRRGDNIKHVLVANLFNYNYTADGELAIASSRAEEAVTSAILGVVSEDRVRVAVLTGNGTAEIPLFSALLADNNYELQTVSLSAGALEDADAALLCAPTIDLSEDAVRMLESFLYNGGQYGRTLLYTASPAQAAMPNLDTFLAEWGIGFLEGGVFETRAERTYQYQPYYPTAEYAEGRYSGMLRDSSMPFLMPLARPMQPLFEAKDGYYVQTLLQFSETAGVRPAGAGEDFTAADAEITGPLPALALSSYNTTGPGGEARRSCVVASASTGMFEGMALQNTSVTNAGYLLAVLRDLTGREDTVDIQPKSLSGQTLGLTSAQVTGLGVVLVGVLPLAIIALGVVSWLLRRYR